ncbi:MAG: hypothetical protein JXD23_06625 [Spirochaetales bacterium]|nr:hypothetical protein [Spirochaetales bacterium]
MVVGKKRIAFHFTQDGRPVTEDYFSDLDYWNKLSGDGPENSYAVFGETENRKHPRGNVLGWKDLRKMLISGRFLTDMVARNL